MTMAQRNPRKADPNHPRCTLRQRKLRYRTMKAAERVMAEMVVHGHGYAPRRVYRCQACGGWHITSQEKA